MHAPALGASAGPPSAVAPPLLLGVAAPSTLRRTLMPDLAAASACAVKEAHTLVLEFLGLTPAMAEMHLQRRTDSLQCELAKSEQYAAEDEAATPHQRHACAVCG